MSSWDARARARAWRVLIVQNGKVAMLDWTGYQSELSTVTGWISILPCESHLSVKQRSFRRACARVENSALPKLKTSPCWLWGQSCPVAVADWISHLPCSFHKPANCGSFRRACARAWRLSSVLHNTKLQFWLGFESEPSAVTDWIFNLERGSHVSVSWRSVRRACAGSRVESRVLATIEKSQCWPGN